MDALRNRASRSRSVRATESASSPEHPRRLRRNERKNAKRLKGKLPTKVRFGIDLEAFEPLLDIQCRLHWQFASVPGGSPVFVYEQGDCLDRGICR